MIGLFYDEFDIGRVIELGSHEFYDGSISRFSAAFTPVGFHLDEAQAAQGLFGRKAAAGFHICCGWMSCFVATNTRERKRLAENGMALPDIGPSPGVQNIRWPSPVHPGDAVSFRITLTAKRELASRTTWGIVSMLAEGHKADGTLVMSFEGKVLVARRG